MYRKLARHPWLPGPGKQKFWANFITFCLAIPFLVGNLLFLVESFDVFWGVTNFYECSTGISTFECSAFDSYLHLSLGMYMWAPLVIIGSFAILLLDPLEPLAGALTGGALADGWWLPYVTVLFVLGLVFAILNHLFDLTTKHEAFLRRAFFVFVGTAVSVALITLLQL
jgi:hypothetical protein